MAINENVTKVSKLEADLQNLMRKFTIEISISSDDESFNDPEDGKEVPKQAQKRKRAKTGEEIQQEIAEVFVENNTSEEVTYDEVELCEKSQF